jgi:predicted amidohydrolase
MDLNVTIVQTPLHWQDAGANRRLLAEKFNRLEAPTDLIVLPEMFTTGFSMAAPQLAETMAGPTLSWLAAQAHRHQAVITGSLIIAADGQYYNRLIWMRPDGRYDYYDKRHLFRMAGEHHTYAPGQQRLIVELRGWRICPLVCYDLRFPVWSRNQEPAYDLLLYVANWPEKRRLAWQTLLQARAIENLAYVIGVNRTGEDGQGIGYAGDSVVHAPNGQILWHQSGKEASPTLRLERQELTDFRASFPAYLDADLFRLT